MALTPEAVSLYRMYSPAGSYSGNYYHDDYDFEDSYESYGYDDYGIGSSFGFGSGVPWSIGGVSIISLIFLGLIIYKLDIPRNGLGALRNLNFFEMMYLYNMLQQIFGGGHRHRRGGYGGYRGYGGGYRRSPYGYGGYGRRGFW